MLLTFSFIVPQMYRPLNLPQCNCWGEGERLSACLQVGGGRRLRVGRFNRKIRDGISHYVKLTDHVMRESREIQDAAHPLPSGFAIIVVSSEFVFHGMYTYGWPVG